MSDFTVLPRAHGRGQGPRLAPGMPCECQKPGLWFLAAVWPCRARWVLRALPAWAGGQKTLSVACTSEARAHMHTHGDDTYTRGSVPGHTLAIMAECACRNVHPNDRVERKRQER